MRRSEEERRAWAVWRRAVALAKWLSHHGGTRRPWREWKKSEWLALIVDGLLSRHRQKDVQKVSSSAAAEQAARSNSASRLLAYGRYGREETLVRRSARLLGSRRRQRNRYGVPAEPFYAAIRVGDDPRTDSSSSEKQSDDDEDEEERRRRQLERRRRRRRENPPFPASFPPTPRSRGAALRAEGQRRAHDLVVSSELLKAEVRIVYAEEDDFGLNVARSIRRRRAPPLFSPALAATGVQVSGLHAARVASGTRFASTRCASPLPRRAWIYFQVRVDDDPPSPTSSHHHPQNDAAAEHKDDTERQTQSTFLRRQRSGLLSSLLSSSNDPSNDGAAAKPTTRHRQQYERKSSSSSSLVDRRPPLVELAVGLAPHDLPRAALCGLSPHSASVVSIGGLLVANKWRPSRSLDGGELSVFRPGDTVGVLAYHDDHACLVRFDVNGQRHTDTFSLATSQLWRHAYLRLYPTVSFRTPGVGVHGRFSADDVDIGNPASLGLPPGEPVYALDGTRLV